MILDKIVSQKKIDLEIFKKNNDIQSLVKKAKEMPKKPSFKEVLAKKVYQ